MTQNIGHFGMPALLVAGAALLALILHLTVPYGYLEGSGVENGAISRDDVADGEKIREVGPASTGTTLTGLILAVVAGVALAALSFAPMPVAAARVVGWLGGALAVVGGTLAFIASMFWVGDGAGGFILKAGGPFHNSIGGGLTGAIEAMTGADQQGTLWVISPILTATLAGIVCVAGLNLCANVVRRDNGMRERANGHLKMGRWALLFIAVALVVPWSLTQMPPADNPGAEGGDWYLIGAHGAMLSHEFTAGTGVTWFGAATSSGSWFDGLTFTLKIFIATTWVIMAMALLGSLGGVLASLGAPAPISRATHFAVFASLAMMVWSAIMYIIAWSVQWNPYSGAEAQPGYAPVLLVAPFFLLVLQGWRLTRQALNLSAKGGKLPDPVAFD